MLNTLSGLFTAAVLAGTPLLLGALGEILTEKSGNLNLGVEGMMFMGAITGLAGSYYYEQAVIQGRGNAEWPGFGSDCAFYFVHSRLAGSADLWIPYDYSAGKPECNRTYSYDLRYGIRLTFSVNILVSRQAVTLR